MKEFKWDAKDYEKNSRSQHKWGQELIAKLDLKDDEHVMDIGCGCGKVTAGISKIVPQGMVLGFDNSREMINLAMTRYPSDSYSNLKFQVLDAQEINFKDQFNVIFSNAVLHWVPDHLLVLKGIFESLKAGGKVLLQMGGRGNAEKILNVLSILISENKWKNYFTDFEVPYRFYSPEEYHPWIEQIGFKEKRIELIPKDMCHDDQSGLEGWIRTTWLPFTERIPENLRDVFISEIAERYNEENPQDENGRIHIGMVRLEVELEKPDH